jgi:hypothetical protein
VGKTSSRTLAAAVAAGALIAIPATASAAPGPSAASVKAYTVKADAALDRAVAMFEKDNDRAGIRQFRLSRAWLGKAKMMSTRLANRADTAGERTRAANAWRLIALQRDENMDELVALFDKVNAAVDKMVAQALLADTKHRDAAIATIQELIDAGVNPKVETSLNELIAHFSSGRATEIGQQMNALAEVKLPTEAQKAVAMAIQTSLASQARAAALLNGLIPQLPDASRTQLQAALDMVHDQLQAAYELMDDVVDLMPPFVRPMVEKMLADVKAMIAAIAAPFVPSAPPAPTTPTAPSTPPPPPPPPPSTAPTPPPAQMPSWIWDMIKQFWPVGTPLPTAPPNAPAPGMAGFFDAWFGPNGFMGGMFGPSGFMSGFFGGGA